jgi:hypothetical protein
MAQDLVTMSAKELKRLEVIRRVVESRWPQARAAALLGLTTRQVRRMCRAFEEAGARGVEAVGDVGQKGRFPMSLQARGAIHRGHEDEDAGVPSLRALGRRVALTPSPAVRPTTAPSDLTRPPASRRTSDSSPSSGRRSDTSVGRRCRRTRSWCRAGGWSRSHWPGRRRSHPSHRRRQPPGSDRRHRPTWSGRAGTPPRRRRSSRRRCRCPRTHRDRRRGGAGRWRSRHRSRRTRLQGRPWSTHRNSSGSSSRPSRSRLRRRRCSPSIQGGTWRPRRRRPYRSPGRDPADRSDRTRHSPRC